MTSLQLLNSSPKEDAFRFPAEFEQHQATWLTFPHNLDTWPTKILGEMLPSYLRFIELLTHSEQVNIIANNEYHKAEILEQLMILSSLEIKDVNIYVYGSNDSWCRDHGPAFVIHKESKRKRIVDWHYNAWGGKYPPYDLDNKIPRKIAHDLKLEVYCPQMVLEGGSVELNGQGDLITTESCLLNPNRNSSHSKEQIENKLRNFFNVQRIHWLGEGIKGDDTDGHIDDMVRFASPSTILACLEDDSCDTNYHTLQENWERLQSIRLGNNKKPEIISLPMPKPIFIDGERLPASYANFYICNKYIIVPTYRCKNDQKAMSIIQKAFPTRQVRGIDSSKIIWGLGSFHCLSQQEPLS